MLVHIFINGEKRKVHCQPDAMLLEVLLAARVSNAAVIQPTAVFVPYGWTANRCCPVLFRQPE